MWRTFLALTLLLAACGDTGSETDNNTSNNTTSTNNPPNNVSANNSNNANNGATSTNNSTTGACRFVEGDIVASTDTDLDPYRGESCIRVDGSVLLSGGVGDLSDLAFEEISGDLRIEETVATAAPFGQLRTVGGSIVVRGNPGISTLDSFGSLESIGHNLLVAEGPIATITGFGRLTEVTNLLLADLPDLTDLSGFDALSTVRGDFSIVDLPSLTSLDGFANLLRARSVTLYRNDNLASADALGSLEPLSDIEVALNNSLGALPLTATDGAMVRISQNDALTDISALGSSTLLDLLWLISNGSLEVVELPNLRDVYRDLIIESQPTTTLDLSQMELYNEVRFEDLPLLTLSGVGLRTGSGIELYELDNLSTIDFPRLRNAYGTLNIRYNDSLTRLGTLRNMSRIGYFYVRDHPRLPACEVDAVITAVDVGTSINNNNDGTGPCPVN